MTEAQVSILSREWWLNLSASRKSVMCSLDVISPFRLACTVAFLSSIALGQNVHIRCETDGAITVCVSGKTATRTIVTEDSARKDSITVKEAMKFFATKAENGIAKSNRSIIKSCTEIEAALAPQGKTMTQEQKKSCDDAADWLYDHGYKCYQDGHCEKAN